MSFLAFREKLQQKQQKAEDAHLSALKLHASLVKHYYSKPIDENKELHERRVLDGGRLVRELGKLILEKKKAE